MALSAQFLVHGSLAYNKIEKKLEKVSSKQLEDIVKAKKTVKFAYNSILQTIVRKPQIIQNKWSHDLSCQIEDWSSLFQIPFSCTIQTKLQSFQYKIMQRTLATNRFLTKIKNNTK